MPRKSLTYFTPDQLTGLTLWLKADSITANDGDALSTWSDSSGNGNDATNSGAAGTKPAYKAAFTNGKPAVTFDGGDGFTVANESNFDIATPTVFFVATRTSGSGNLMGKSTTGFSDGRRRKLQFGFTSATNLQAASGADGTVINTTVTSTSVPAIYCFASASDTSHKINYNGTNTNSTTTLSESSSNFNNASLLIGSNFSIGTEGFIGDAAEYILFNRALSDDEIVGVMNYLASKYNIKNDVIGGYPRTAVSNRIFIKDFVTCLNFRTTSDYVTVTHNSNLDFTTNFTFSLWAFPRSFGTVNLGNILFKGGGFANGYALTWRNNTGQNTLRFAANNTTYQSSSNNIITLNKWQHIALTFDSAAGSNQLKFYVNGVASGTASLGSALTPFTADLGIGDQPLGGRTADSLLDDVKMYNRTLSPTEITDEYYGRAVSTTGLVLWHKYDEGSGTTATDSSSGGNTGTITSAPYSTNVVRKARTAL